MSDCGDRCGCPYREPARLVVFANGPDHRAVALMACVKHAAQIFIIAHVGVRFIEQQCWTRGLYRAEQGRGCYIAQRAWDQTLYDVEQSCLAAAFFRRGDEQSWKDEEPVERMGSGNPQCYRISCRSA